MIAHYADLARLHMPVLTLVLLIGGAALAFLSPHARVSWGIAVAVSVAAAGLGVVSFWQSLVHGVTMPMAHAGVALSLDGVGAFSAPWLSVYILCAVICAAPQRDLFERTGPHALALALAAAGAWTGAIFAADLVGLIVATQAGWLACVGVVGLSADRGARNGAQRMWAAGGFGAALMMLGAGLLFHATGSAQVSAIALRPVEASAVASIGLILMMAPLAIMAGLAPFHVWAGAAYGRGGDFAAVVIGGVPVIGALAVLTRLAAFAASAPGVADQVFAALVLFGAVSVAIGAVQAVGAVNVRRMVAYASATQAGCIVLTLALGSPAGFAAALVQLAAWAAAVLALLCGVSAAQGADLRALDGLSRRAPLASLAIVFGALSLMGAPLTIGFLGRWRLIEASVGAGLWWTTGAAVVASLAAVFYGGRLIERMYFRRANQTTELDRGAWRVARAPVLVAAMALVALGVAPAFLLQASVRAAALIMDHGG